MTPDTAYDDYDSMILSRYATTRRASCQRVTSYDYSSIFDYMHSLLSHPLISGFPSKNGLSIIKCLIQLSCLDLTHFA